jgi:hypothetical protein
MSPDGTVAPPAGALPGDVRPDRMVRAFHLGLKDLLPLWEQALSDETLTQLYPLGSSAPRTSGSRRRCGLE